MNPRKLEHGFRMISARIPFIYLKGIRTIMCQLFGFYNGLGTIGFKPYVKDLEPLLRD